MGEVIKTRIIMGSSLCCSGVTNPTRIHEDVGSIPGLVQWVKDPGCCKLWCRSQTQLGFPVAVAAQ